MVESAGILFTDERMVLVGYKSFKGHITGIGGKQKKGETLFETAVRETVEELFDLSCVSPEFIVRYSALLNPFKTVKNKEFTHYLCTFKQLEALLVDRIITNSKSSIYLQPPLTLEALLLTRVPTEKTELSHLALLPYVCDLRIAGHLSSDLSK
jgi:hypothetical protein